MLRLSLVTLPTHELERIHAVCRVALSQAGAKQNWSRYDEAKATLRLIDEELQHRAEQLAEHPTLF